MDPKMGSEWAAGGGGVVRVWELAFLKMELSLHGFK